MYILRTIYATCTLNFYKTISNNPIVWNLRQLINLDCLRFGHQTFFCVTTSNKSPQNSRLVCFIRGAGVNCKISLSIFQQTARVGRVLNSHTNFYFLQMSRVKFYLWLTVGSLRAHVSLKNIQILPQIIRLLILVILILQLQA